MQVRILNLLGEPVTVYDRDLPMLMLPARGRARAIRVETTGPEVDAEGVRLPFVAHRFQVDGVPPERFATLLLVKPIVADLLPHRADLVYPDLPVTDDAGAVVGYRRLAGRDGQAVVLLPAAAPQPLAVEA